MPQPRRHLRDIGVMREGLRLLHRALRVYTEAVHVDRDADLASSPARPSSLSVFIHEGLCLLGDRLKALRPLSHSAGEWSP